MNKEKFIVEYDLKSVSPTLLWSYIGTKNGLADWFAQAECKSQPYPSHFAYCENEGRRQP